MATFSAVTRQHILQAIEEYDARGGEAFLGVYGFDPSRGYALVHEGRDYDSKAIVGVAHRYATGRVATSEEFHGGAHGAADVLRKRGFVVTEPQGPRRDDRTTTARRPAPRRNAVPERPEPVCPSCFMTLPGTGVCDSCG